MLGWAGLVWLGSPWDCIERGGGLSQKWKIDGEGWMDGNSAQ